MAPNLILTLFPPINPDTQYNTGASIPSFCFSNALGWRLNFAIQVIVIIIRAALVLYIIYYFATSFSDSELAAVRICQLVTIVLSSLSQSPLFHMSFKSTWLINLRPVDSNYQNRVNNNVPHGNRVHLGNEVRTRHDTIEFNRIQQNRIEFNEVYAYFIHID